jgi:hypothetical protein
MMVVTTQVYRECIVRIDYEGLLPRYRHAMQRYVEQGCEPGDALLHVLQNDLKAVLLFEDPVALHAVFSWVNRELPDPTWGNRSTVQNWMRVAHRHSKAAGVSASRAYQSPERRSNHGSTLESSSARDPR